MDIVKACVTIRQWHEALVGGRAVTSTLAELVAGVRELKRYLERARANGVAIRDL